MASTPVAKSAQSPQETKQKAVADKSAEFKKAANLHVNRALAAVEKIGKLSNRRKYVYDVEQAEKIATALDKAFAGMKAQFQAAIEGKDAATSSKFTL